MHFAPPRSQDCKPRRLRTRTRWRRSAKADMRYPRAERKTASFADILSKRAPSGGPGNRMRTPLQVKHGQGRQQECQIDDDLANGRGVLVAENAGQQRADQSVARQDAADVESGFLQRIPKAGFMERANRTG